MGHRADPGFLAVSSQVTFVINPVLSYRIPPGPWLQSRYDWEIIWML